MTIGQIVYYHNLGIELKHGKPKTNKPKTFADMTPAEVRAKRAELKAMREGMADKYGDIDG